MGAKQQNFQNHYSTPFMPISNEGPVLKEDFGSVFFHLHQRLAKKERGYLLFTIRPVVPEGAGLAMAPPDFGRSVNPISTKGGRLCPPSNTSNPDYQTFRRS